MKTSFTLILTFVSFFSIGQISKGTKMVGASIGGINALFVSHDDPVINLSLNPSVVKFRNNRLAYGGMVSAGVNTNSGDVAFTLGVSPVIRWYNNSIKSDRFFLQANTGLYTQIQGDPIFYFSYGAGVGYNRFFAENLALELGLNYTGFAGDIEGVQSISLGFGVQIFLRPKKERSAIKQ